jgi:hypothetical protein
MTSPGVHLPQNASQCERHLQWQHKRRGLSQQQHLHSSRHRSRGLSLSSRLLHVISKLKGLRGSHSTPLHAWCHGRTAIDRELQSSWLPPLLDNKTGNGNTFGV